LLSCVLAVTATTAQAKDTRDVIFVGNNWEGMIDADTYQNIGRINGIPDKRRRMTEILFNPVRLVFFKAVRYLIGEGHDQYVDDMYSTQDGRLLIVSRPSFAEKLDAAGYSDLSPAIRPMPIRRMNASSTSSCRSCTALWSTTWSRAWSPAGRRCQTWYRICHGSSTSTILRTTALP
jgi:hypothetical protein